MINRREAIQQLAILTSGALVYPMKLEWANAATVVVGRSNTLEVFADTIVPGHGVRLKQALDDPFYGFKPFKPLLAIDLRMRSRRIHGTRAFKKLSLEQRNEVIADAMKTKGTVQRLYSGAIQIVQLAFYTGYTLQPEACEQIGFTAVYDGRDPSYPESNQFFGSALTANGNLS